MASNWAKGLSGQLSEILTKATIAGPLPNYSGKPVPPPTGVPTANSYNRAKAVMNRLEKEYSELSAVQAPTAEQIRRRQNLEVAILDQENIFNKEKKKRKESTFLRGNLPNKINDLLKPEGANTGYQSNEGFVSTIAKGMGFAGGRRKTRKGKGSKGKSRRRNRK